MSRDKEDLLRRLRENIKDYADVVQPAIENVDERNMDVWPVYTIKKLDKWVSKIGKVMIAGDAAHIVLWILGQSTDQNIEDVDLLAALLSKLSPNIRLSDALDFWQAHRQKRIQKLVTMTMNSLTKLSNIGSVVGAANDLSWLYKPSLEEDVAAWLREHDVPGRHVMAEAQEPGISEQACGKRKQD